jgi:hypothetical protein
MEAHPDRDSAAKLSKHCFWPIGSGGTKAGKNVAARTISYVLTPQAPKASSTSLDLVTALANAFDLPPWRLLADDQDLRMWAVEQIGSRPPVPATDPEAAWRARSISDDGARSGAVHKQVKRRKGGVT